MSSFAKSNVAKKQKTFTIKKAGKSGNPAKVAAEQTKLEATLRSSDKGYLVGSALAHIPFNYVSLNPKGVKGLLKIAKTYIEDKENDLATDLISQRFSKWLIGKPAVQCEHYGRFNMKAIEKILIPKKTLLIMDPKLDEKTLFLYTKGWLMAEYEHKFLKDKQPGFQYEQESGSDAMIKLFGKEASLLLGLTERSSGGEMKRALSSRLFPIYFTSMFLGYLKHRDSFFLPA